MRQATARFDRRITILKRVNVRNQKFGTDKAEWVAHATVAAQVEDMLPSRADRIVDVVDVNKRPCRVRIRWRGDLAGELRLRISGADYGVVSGPAELGRREGMELVAQLLSVEGQRP